MKLEKREKEFLTRAEVCELLGIGQTKLWMLTSSGELPVIRIGTCVRVARQDFDEFVRRNRTTMAAHQKVRWGDGPGSEGSRP